MCLAKRIQEIQAQKAALDAQILRFEQLESKTQPVTEMLKELIEEYRAIAPEELPSLLSKISEMCFFDLSADKRKEESEFKQSGFQSLLEYEIATGQAMEENTAPQPEYGPEECRDTIESVLEAKGFFQSNDLEDYGSNEKYETYRGWDIYYSLPNGGIVAIGLYNKKYNQPWDANTEYIQEVDPTFPESLADFAEIVAWTRELIDQVENLEAPGQLALEFPEPTDAEIQEELGCRDDVPPQTKLQELLAGNSDFTFGELHARVTVASVFVEEEIEIESEDDSDNPATQQVEQALFTVMDFTGNQKEYYYDAEALVYKCSHSGNTVKSEAEKLVVQQFNTSQELVKPETKLSVDPRIELFRGDLSLTSMDMTAEMMSSTSGKNLSGVSFCFFDLEGKKLFESTQTASEIGDQQPLFLALKLVSAWKSKQEALPVNNWEKPQDAFTELVKISNAVGYIKRKDNGEILAGYAAFGNRTPEGNKTVTMAKSRSAKWAEWLRDTFQIKCDAPRVPKRMVSDNSKQPFAYEIKIKGLTMWQLEKLAEEDFSLLPGEMEEKLQNQELRRSELKTPATPEKATSTGTESTSDGLTDEQYLKPVDEELALDDADRITPTPTPVVKFTGVALSPECGLNEDEIELVEMAVAAISACDSEMVKSVNSVFKEVCEKNAANRVKVWNALTEDEQQTYKLLLQMEFAKAPDFSDQTPEYIVYFDGKVSANVWISLRTIDGVPSRAWRYTNQGNEIGYKSKEAAAIAAIQQQAG